MVVFGSIGLMSISIKLGCELVLSLTIDGSAGGIYFNNRFSDGLMNLLLSGAFLIIGVFPSPLGIDWTPAGDSIAF